MAEASRLDDAAVEARLARLDDVLSQLERIPGATAALAMEAVQSLTEVYGAALARIVDVAPIGVLETFDRDELLRHLMVLHDLHPHPVEQRIEAALDSVRPYLRSHGGDVVLVGIEDGIVRVAFSGHCDGCTSSTATMEAVVRDAVLGMAPELSGVEAEPATAPAHPAPVIPLESLLRRTAASV
jgi:Fe-S cluster biogenesis protein NfuA